MIDVKVDRRARDDARQLWNALACGELDGDKASIDYFERVAADRYTQQPWTKEYFEYGAFKGQRVLEIGVGQGTDLLEFAKGGAKCFGVDITKNHLELTRQNFGLHGFGVELFEADATRLPFPDEHFDCVYSFGVLHHIPEIERVMDEIYRILKPGGEVRIALYHKWSAYFLIRKMLQGTLDGSLFRLGYAGVLSTIETGADGKTVKPFVSVWSKTGTKRLLKRFRLNDVSVHQLQAGHVLPLRSKEKAERPIPLANRFGWYVAAKAIKPHTSLRPVVLSVQALSAGYRAQVEQQYGHVDYLLVPTLRKLGVSAAIRAIRRLCPPELLIACEDSDSKLVLPVLELIALSTRADTVAVLDAELQRTPLQRTALVSATAETTVGTVACFAALLKAQRELAQLNRATRIDAVRTPVSEVVYLNANLWYGVKAGGSVGHIAGVANDLHRRGWKVRYAAVSDSPVMDADIERLMLQAPETHGLPPEINHYRFSQAAYRQALRACEGRKPSFIYQRMSACNYTGARLSRALNVPLVLEYNGSEVWAARHWGRPFTFEQAALAAENASLRHAHLLVTISEPLVDELVEHGVERNRIVCYPNCVDAEVFDPARFSQKETTAVRALHNLTPQDTVIGFIGTFGRWHGVDVLVEAMRRLVDTDQAWLDQHRVRFFIVGDGQLMPLVRERVADERYAKYVRLPGLVRQREAPLYLAASDILASPHVPNPDGSAFFGSPTKLFEYMAMERAIVGSDLDQIGQVLSKSLRVNGLPANRPGKNDDALAILGEPGSVDDLVAGLRFAVEHPEWRELLARNARQEVLQKYLWRHHVDAILAAIPS